MSPDTNNTAVITENESFTVETIDRQVMNEKMKAGEEFTAEMASDKSTVSKGSLLTEGMSDEEKQAFYIALEQKFKHKLQIIVDAKNRAKRRSPIHVKRAKNRAKRKFANKSRKTNKSLG